MRSLALGTLLTLAGAGAAFAQVNPPRGIPLDNQEPRPGVVQERERAAGIAPSAQENRAEQQTVDQLYRELTGRNPNDPSASPGMPPQDEGGRSPDPTGGTPGRPAR